MKQPSSLAGQVTMSHLLLISDKHDFLGVVIEKWLPHLMALLVYWPLIPMLSYKHSFMALSSCDASVQFKQNKSLLTLSWVYSWTTMMIQSPPFFLMYYIIFKYLGEHILARMPHYVSSKTFHVLFLYAWCYHCIWCQFWMEIYLPLQVTIWKRTLTFRD